MTTTHPMPDYVIIRISKQEQKDRKFKIGSLYIPEQLIFMTRNCQAGEIVEVGAAAQELLPNAKPGDALIVHHFLESESKPYFIDSDNIYNYYTCPCMLTNMNLTYGYYNGETIIPHPQYVFLKVEEKDSQEMEVNKSGLLTFKNWEVSREDNELKLNRLKAEAQELAKTDPTRPDVKVAIETREAEAKKISKQINSKKLIPFKLAYAHPTLSESFGKWLKQNDILYCANFACGTKMEFQKTEYIMCKVEHIHFLVDERFPHKINPNSLSSI